MRLPQCGEACEPATPGAGLLYIPVAVAHHRAAAAFIVRMRLVFTPRISNQVYRGSDKLVLTHGLSGQKSAARSVTNGAHAVATED